MHVHDDNGVGPVTHDELLGLSGEGVHAVDSDVHPRRSPQGFERVLTLCSLQIPNLYCSIRAGTTTIQFTDELKVLKEQQEDCTMKTRGPWATSLT